METDETPKTPPEVPREAPDLRFLTETDARFLISHLSGVTSVMVRVLGEHPDAGPEVAAFLRASGYEVRQETLQRMEPPPLTRFALRYQGKAATLTVAPAVPS
ncbi:hypothetical protein [Frigidibacter mobilis]|uniref:Uncharacterized protein n=1 Tax=Frigidibacter mobilis TaxID=1335048 RepID=A0A165STB7_9RHOB|nr:hypothetical protein [Frigidibacter mobilis]AMY70843.1 hypothetical protein AKL17_3619 [Frigidibacter mobilis]